MRREEQGFANGLYHMGNWVLRITGTVIFAGLVWYALKYTYHMEPGYSEMPINEADSIWKNLLAAMAAVLLLTGLLVAERHMSKKIQRICCLVTLGIAMLWTGGAGLWWIRSADRVPQGDQAFIYGGASYFQEGEFFFLNKGSYLNIYPHQLTLVALCELLFVFAGAYNYYAIEKICVILAVGIVYAGYRIVSELTEHTAVIVGSNLLMLGCAPLVFYTSWCYGDIPSIFCTLIAAWMLAAYSRYGKKRYLAVMAAAVTMALLFRRHSAILLIALCIAAGLYALKKKDIRIVAAVFLTVALCWISHQGIYKMYEYRSGIAHEPGIPTSTWIAMGLQDGPYSFPGWYNDYPKTIYYEFELDIAKTSAHARQNIKERMGVFAGDLGYAKRFFREKILSQWNQPLYQSIFFNTRYQEGEGPKEDSLAAKVSGSYYGKLLAFCDRWQFVVYLGMLCYFLFAVKKDSNILEHLLGITMIGGFFFSIIFEAKARYIFPYYVMMFPFAVYGYQQMFEAVVKLFGVKRQEETIEEKEILEKTA